MRLFPGKFRSSSEEVAWEKQTESVRRVAGGCRFRSEPKRRDLLTLQKIWSWNAP
jgi:hypothetical protein